MTKLLIITEKPSVAKDIVEAISGFEEHDSGEYYESDEYVCTYAVGHILTLFSPEDIDPIYKRWRLTDLPIIPENFKTKPVYNQVKRLQVITKLINRKDIQTIINACDAAREGELIFREIIKHLDSTKPVKRLWLQSLTKKAIQEGFNNLQDGDKYLGLAAAAECRAHADWLIGMNATRALTVRLKSRNQRGMSWSVGRVQTPTLALLVDRECEILQHVPVPYWKIMGRFATSNHEYDGVWYDPNFKKPTGERDIKEDRIFEQEKAGQILDAVKGVAGKARETRKTTPRKAPNLFDLTSLQRAANAKFGWSATRTLRAAQRCYENHKVLTYPRTSSKALPSDYESEVDKVLNTFMTTGDYQTFASFLVHNGMQNKERVFNDAGVTDHFAIIPTGEIRDLSGDDKKLFDLVSRQFLAAFYPPSIYEEVERITQVGGHSFRTRPPKVLKIAGWEAVFGKKSADESIDDALLPPLGADQNNIDNVDINTLNVQAEDLETKAPPRITEAGLLSLMENAGRQVNDEELASVLHEAEGLGTAATRADIIEALKTREYVDKNLRPTVKGIRLVDVLHRIGASQLTSAKLTAELELHLSEVERGQRQSSDFINEIIGYVRQTVDTARDFDFEAIYQDGESLGKCPKCGNDVFERAWFYGCTESTKRYGSKDCDFLIWKDHNGRYINKNVVKTLLKVGKTGELEGFLNSNGNSYKAILSLENGTLSRQPVEGSEEEGNQDGLEVNHEPIASCPVHLDQDCMVIESPHEFICQLKKKAKSDGDTDVTGFSFPRVLCKRIITREELDTFLREKQTPFLTGFVSKRGRPFSAKLNFTDGGFTFSFPERSSKKSKGEAEGTDGEQDTTEGEGIDKVIMPKEKKTKKKTKKDPNVEVSTAAVTSKRKKKAKSKGKEKAMD